MTFHHLYQERTEWYPVHINPWRKGVYERSYNFGIRFAHWDGFIWGGFAQDWRGAYNNRKSPTIHPDAAWRGLAKNHDSRRI